MFGKMKYFPAGCFFCREVGSCIGAPNLNGREITICPMCANKLIVGITLGMNEMERIEKEATEKTKLDGEEPVPKDEETQAPEAVTT